MEVLICAEVVKGLYRSFEQDFAVMDGALTDFVVSVQRESDARVLERCVLDDENWEIPVQERMLVLSRAKELGASSIDFLCDYYGFFAAHLDPGPEHAEAERMLGAILRS